MIRLARVSVPKNVRGACAPPAPVRLAAVAQPDGSVRVTWRRRSRGGWRWRDGGDAPLVEEQERYRVTIAGGGGTRTVVSEEPVVTVSAAERSGGLVTVAQLGTYAASDAAVLALIA